MPKKERSDLPTFNSTRRNFFKTATLAGAGLIINQLAGSHPLFGKNDDDVTDVIPVNIPDGAKLISLLQTTDVHCQIHPHDELFWEKNGMVFRKTGGYANIASYFDGVRKKNPNTFIIDTGDMFQGSALSVKTTGGAMVPILNAMGYDLYLPGNWEVVYYKQRMQKLLGALSAPKVCANMYHDLGDNKKGELVFPPYHTYSAEGIKIGFIGYTDPLVPLRQSPNYSKGIIYTKPEENLAYYVSVLKDQEQCDKIIILAHLGLSQQIALANMPECEGVDWIFGGDTHERVRKPIQCKYAKVVEPGAFGSFVGRLDLVINNGKIVDEVYSLIEINSEKTKPKKGILELAEKSESAFKKDISKVVGYSSIPLYRYFVVENTIDTLILDALKWKVKTDIVLSNGFRFCPPNTTPDQTGNIPITEGFLFDMLPVDSTVRTAVVTGRQLKEWLEKELNNVFSKDASKRFGGWVVKFKGMEVHFKAFEEFGKRVEKITTQGIPLDLEKEYTVCACERDGDPVTVLCRIQNVKNGKNTPFTLHQVLKDYLASNSPVTPKPEGNAIILDAPDTLLTQVTGVDYQFY